ncbi:uncharacterized protein LOC133788231 isoform X2 [Humulus lupulus]|nr:uncharacterized protein LOC133788231 isoform X2 [Humulus lupulus]
MLQWMGGSRRKVTTSRRSTQKRQKQYFEQRKRQQQCQPQTERCETYADETDISGQYQKEHRSLDILSLLNLSTNAKERKSDCFSERKNLDVNASTREYNITNDSPVIIPDRVGPANFVGIKEQSIPSGFQMETASHKKFSPSAPDSHNNALNGIDSKRDQRPTTTEHQLFVLDLLGDDGLNGNVEENPGHEAHVAFSIEGLGKVGMETPVHSPQQSSRTFSYGISSPLRAAGRQKLSRKFNSLMDDLEFEDTMMDGLNVPLSSDYLEFSPNIMDPINSPQHNSFTVRDSWQQDNCSSKRNRAFGHGNEDKWTGRPTFSHHRFFDEREHDMSRKTWQSPTHDNSADHVIYRNSNNDMEDFSFEGLHQPMRAGDRIPNKFGVLESTFSYTRHPAPEYDHDYLMSNWDRAPTLERILEFKPETSPPDRFCFMTEDAIDNSSLQSEESCSSSAARYQATGNFLPNSTSRQGRRGQCNAFACSGDKHGLKKAVANINKDDIQRENMASGSAKHTNMINNSNLKPSHPSSFQENFGAEDVWFFEKAHTTIDMFPGSDSFNQNFGTKNNGFHSDFLDKDPFSKFPTPKLHVGASPLWDRFNCEPPECSPPEIFTPKIPLHASSMNLDLEPDIHVDCELRRRPQDSSSIAGSQGETPSPDLSAQESFSKDVEYKPKFEPSNCGTSELGEEFCIRNGGLVCEDKEAKDASYSKEIEQEDRKKGLPDPEETSRSVDITEKSGSPKYEDDCADKTPLPNKNGKEEVEDFGHEGRFGYKQNSGYVDSSCQAIMFQSYVFQFFCVHKRLM